MSLVRLAILWGLAVAGCSGMTNGTVDQPSPVDPVATVDAREPAKPALLSDGSDPVRFYCVQWVWDRTGPADIFCESRLEDCKVQRAVERQKFPDKGHFTECFARIEAECARMKNLDGVEQEVCGGDEADCLIRMASRQSEGYRLVRACRRISGLELPGMRQAELIP